MPPGAREIRGVWVQANTGARRFHDRHGFVVVRLGSGEDNEERCPDVLFDRAGGGPLAE